jgi:hypothetical protein
MRDFGRIPFLGYIKIAITTTELRHIRDPVNTGADNVLVLFPVTGSQPARTDHVAVAFLIEEETPE